MSVLVDNNQNILKKKNCTSLVLSECAGGIRFCNFLEAQAFKLMVCFIIHHGHQVDENKIDLQVLILFL